MKYRYIRDYKGNPVLRESFFSLAKLIYGIDFKTWYDAGGWNDRYVCHSFADSDRVIANVSTSGMDIIREGKLLKALQTGTVMTHPDYRKTGLSSLLINKALEENEGRYDFVYLFANESVFDFYPRFGFRQAEEFQAGMDLSPGNGEGSASIKLDANKDLETIKRLALHRRAVSRTLGAVNDYHLIMFHCLLAFPNDLHYLPEEDLLIIYKVKGEQLTVYDMIGTREFRVIDIIRKINAVGVKKVIFNFTPDSESGLSGLNPIPIQPRELFIRSGDFTMPEKSMFPYTSRA